MADLELTDDEKALIEERRKKASKKKANPPGSATEEEEERGFVPSEEEEALLEEERERKRREKARRERRLEDRPARRSINGMALYKPAIIVGIAILLIGYLFIGASFVSKDDFTRNIQDMLGTMETMKADVATSTNAVDNAVAKLSDSVTTQVNTSLQQVTDRLNTIETNTNDAKSQAANANEQMSNMSGTVEESGASLAEARKKISALEVLVNAHKVSIHELEGGSASSDDGTDAKIPFAYSVSLRDDGFPTDSSNRTSLSLRVVLDNKTTKDVEDVSMEFEVELYGDDEDIDLSFRPRVSLSGWRVKEWGMDYIILKGTGMTVDRNDKYSKVMNIEIQWDGETSGEAEIDDDYIEITNWSYE